MLDTDHREHSLLLVLPGGEQILTEKYEKTTGKRSSYTDKSSATNSDFAFTTTNFDDGWTSTAKEDWVEVTKANIKVLIHYPK